MEVEIFVKCEQCHFRFRLKTKLGKHMSNCNNKFKNESRYNKIFQKWPQVLEEGRKSCKM